MWVTLAVALIAAGPRPPLALRGGGAPESELLDSLNTAKLRLHALEHRLKTSRDTRASDTEAEGLEPVIAEPEAGDRVRVRSRARARVRVRGGRRAGRAARGVPPSSRSTSAGPARARLASLRCNRPCAWAWAGPRAACEAPRTARTFGPAASLGNSELRVWEYARFRVPSPGSIRLPAWSPESVRFRID